MLYILTLKETLNVGYELRVLEWHAKEGERLTNGQLLVELESHKAVIEIRVAQSAFLRKILVSTEESQSPGKPVAVLSDSLDELIPDSFVDLMEVAVDYLFM